jgi:hypothetical protein
MRMSQPRSISFHSLLLGFLSVIVESVGSGRL